MDKYALYYYSLALVEQLRKLEMILLSKNMSIIIYMIYVYRFINGLWNQRLLPQKLWLK